MLAVPERMHVHSNSRRLVNQSIVFATLNSFRLSPYSAAGRAPHPAPTIPGGPSDATPSVASSHSGHPRLTQANLALLSVSFRRF